MRKLLAAAVVVGALLLGSAQAQTAGPLDDPALLADVQCLVLSFRMAASTDERYRDAGFKSAFYFLGRVDGRAPNLDLEEAIAQTDGQLTGEEIATHQQRCGTQLQTRGREIIEIGNRLQQRGAAQQR